MWLIAWLMMVTTASQSDFKVVVARNVKSYKISKVKYILLHSENKTFFQQTFKLKFFRCIRRNANLSRDPLVISCSISMSLILPIRSFNIEDY